MTVVQPDLRIGDNLTSLRKSRFHSTAQIRLLFSHEVGEANGGLRRVDSRRLYRDTHTRAFHLTTAEAMKSYKTDFM